MTDAAIDRGFLDHQTFGDAGVCAEVLRLFVATAPGLAEAAMGPDGAAARQAAHRLCGAARGIGAGAVAAAAERISMGEGQCAAEALRQAMAAALDEIAALLSGGLSA